MSETPKPRWSRGLAAGKIPFPQLSPLAKANSIVVGQPSNSSSWKLNISPSTPAAVPTPPPLPVLTAVKPGRSPLWPSLQQGSKQVRQAKEAARSTGQPLVLPDIPSDAPGTSSKGAALRSRLPVQLDADDAKAGAPSTSALPSAEHSPGFSFQTARLESPRPGVGRFSLASTASKVPARFRANPLFSSGSPAAAPSPAPPTPPDNLAKPAHNEVLGMHTADKAATSRLSGTSGTPSLAAPERQPMKALEHTRFRSAAASAPASSSGSSPVDQQTRRQEEEAGTKPLTLAQLSQEASSSAAPHLQPPPTMQKQPPRGSRQPEGGGPQHDNLSNKAKADADGGGGASWKVPLMMARPGRLPGSARRRRSGRPASALAGAIKEAAAAEAREQSPSPPPAFTPLRQQNTEPSEAAAAESVAGLQRLLQDLGIPLTQALPEMPQRPAADAAPAKKTASELGASVQQLRELQAQARGLLEEAVTRDDDGSDAGEHLMLGPERQAPVVPSSRHARLMPNLKAGNGDSLLGQNVGKLQTLLALQEQGNKFAALML